MKHRELSKVLKKTKPFLSLTVLYIQSRIDIVQNSSFHAERREAFGILLSPSHFTDSLVAILYQDDNSAEMFVLSD